MFAAVRFRGDGSQVFPETKRREQLGQNLQITPQHHNEFPTSIPVRVTLNCNLMQLL